MKENFLRREKIRNKSKLYKIIFRNYFKEMNKARQTINCRYIKIIEQCTFCIMGQQPNYSSELNLIKVGVATAI